MRDSNRVPHGLFIEGLSSDASYEVASVETSSGCTVIVGKVSLGRSSGIGVINSQTTENVQFMGELSLLKGRVFS